MRNEKRANAAGVAVDGMVQSEVVISATDLREGTIERLGDDLVIRKPSGEIVRVDGFFSPDAQVRLLSTSGAVYTVSMVEAMLPGTSHASQAATGSSAEYSSGASGDEGDATVVARVVEATADAKVIRNGEELPLHAGDPVFEGDQVITADKRRVTFDTSAKPGEGGDLANNLTVGENSRITLGLTAAGESGNGAETVRVSIKAGSVTAEETPSSMHIVIDTPSGAIQPNNAAVDVKVNASTSEVQVNMLSGAGEVAIQSASGPVVLNQANQSTILSSDSGAAGLVRAGDLSLANAAGTASHGSASAASAAGAAGAAAETSSSAASTSMSGSPFSSNNGFSGLGSTAAEGNGPSLSNTPLAGNATGNAGSVPGSSAQPAAPAVSTPAAPAPAPVTETTPAVTPAISVASTSVDEKEGVAHVHITLSTPTTQPVRSSAK